MRRQPHPTLSIHVENKVPEIASEEAFAASSRGHLSHSAIQQSPRDPSLCVVVAAVAKRADSFPEVAPGRPSRCISKHAVGVFSVDPSLVANSSLRHIETEGRGSEEKSDQ
nr:hypothetical protein L203_02275 [Cryptococcus depauperatus CBS 7841]